MRAIGQIVCRHRMTTATVAPRRPSIRNHAATHRLVRISIVGGITGHGIGTILKVSLGYNPALCGGPRRVLVTILSIAKGVGRWGLLLVLLRRRLIHRGSSRIARQRLRSIGVGIHRRSGSAALVEPLGCGLLRAVIVLGWRPLRWPARRRLLLILLVIVLRRVALLPLLRRRASGEGAPLLLLLKKLGRRDLVSGRSRARLTLRLVVVVPSSVVRPLSRHRPAVSSSSSSPAMRWPLRRRSLHVRHARSGCHSLSATRLHEFGRVDGRGHSLRTARGRCGAKDVGESGISLVGVGMSLLVMP